DRDARPRDAGQEGEDLVLLDELLHARLGTGRLAGTVVAVDVTQLAAIDAAAVIDGVERRRVAPNLRVDEEVAQRHAVHLDTAELDLRRSHTPVGCPAVTPGGSRCRTGSRCGASSGCGAGSRCAGSRPAALRRRCRLA